MPERGRLQNSVAVYRVAHAKYFLEVFEVNWAYSFLKFVSDFLHLPNLYAILDVWIYVYLEQV